MPTRITQEQRDEIIRIHKEHNDYSPSDIARITAVPKSAVSRIIRLQERGFASRVEYEEHLAKQRGFQSLKAYRDFLAQEKGFTDHAQFSKYFALYKGHPSDAAYRNYKAQQKGFPNQRAYKDFLAQEKGYPTHHAYRQHLTVQKGYLSHYDYQKHLALLNGHKSYNDYRDHVAKRNGYESLAAYKREKSKNRRQKPEHIALKDLIRTRLNELEQTVVWLSRELGKSRTTTSLYANGRAIPQPATLERIYAALNVPYKTIDDLLGATSSATETQSHADNIKSK